MAVSRKLGFKLIVLLMLAGNCDGLTKRKIYTLFSSRKTWNEAKAICESKQSQLLKVTSPKHFEEIIYLDRMEWGNLYTNLFFNSSGMWSPLHQPFSNTTWTYHDCEPFSASLTGSPGKCSKFLTTNALSPSLCDEEHIFICERFEGDCWFQPFYEKTPAVFEDVTAVPIIDPNLEAKTCAVECRNLYDVGTGNECWGFTYYPAEHKCMLHVNNTPTASSNYLYPEHRDYGPLKSTFYVRRCFEGVLDTNSYDSFSNKNPEPETSCTDTPYIDNDTVSNVCYCSTQEHPPIREPGTSEEKAEQLAKELTINPTNTSSAIRRLTSAEDNRPSATRIGYLGVGLLTAVFGGLVLFDFNLIVAGFKNILCSTTSVQSVPKDVNQT